MNVFSWFFAGMLAIGVTVAVVLRVWPHFNAFDFMPYITVFAAMGVLPGTRLRLLQRYPAFVFRIGYAEFAVDEALGSRIGVKVNDSPGTGLA